MWFFQSQNKYIKSKKELRKLAGEYYFYYLWWRPGRITVEYVTKSRYRWASTVKSRSAAAAAAGMVFLPLLIKWKAVSFSFRDDFDAGRPLWWLIAVTAVARLAPLYYTTTERYNKRFERRSGGKDDDDIHGYGPVVWMDVFVSLLQKVNCGKIHSASVVYQHILLPLCCADVPRNLFSFFFFCLLADVAMSCLIVQPPARSWHCPETLILDIFVYFFTYFEY